MSRSHTRLASILVEGGNGTRATPLDVFKLARNWWLEGRRLNMGELAEASGISRATLFRWVGTKELLLGEILSQLYSRSIMQIKASHSGSGPAYLADIARDINSSIASFEPMQQFLRQDSEYALRVLTSKTSIVQDRVVAIWRELIEEQIARNAVTPQMSVDDLAYFIVHLGEGCLYSEVVSGRIRTIEPACVAVRLLLGDGGNAKSGASADAEGAAAENR